MRFPDLSTVRKSALTDLLTLDLKISLEMSFQEVILYQALILQQSPLLYGQDDVLTSSSYLQGFGVQAGAQGTGALGSLAKFAESFAPDLAEKLEEIAPIN